MATQFYLQLDGVKGDSQDAGHKDWMDVDNWNIGAHHPSGIKAGGGGSTGKTSFTDLNFTTHLCPASVDMFLFCSNGKTISKGKLECIRETGDSKLKYLVLEMENIIVSNYHTSTAGEHPSADYSLNFAKLTVKYTPQTKDGGKGGEISHYWDVNENKGG
ncbi:MAG: type VI secretion system tube protein Hcp [Burkholderiales bacterium]|nr:type VI secretion system tube protein Hcp [Burkholderiales bacterium]